MTRINVIPPAELSDQHLIAEYHELPRVLKQNINTCNAPNDYVLGAGHVRWARKHWRYTYNRFIELCEEMRYRGFNVNFDSAILKNYIAHLCDKWAEYTVTAADIELSRSRIRAKYYEKPNFYKWTCRKKPDWI